MFAEEETSEVGRDAVFIQDVHFLFATSGAAAGSFGLTSKIKAHTAPYPSAFRGGKVVHCHVSIRVSEIRGRQHAENTHRHTSRVAFSFIWDFLPDKRAHGELVKKACGIRRAALLVPEMEDESEPNDLH